MLPWYVGKYTPKISIINFEAAKEFSRTAEKPMIEKRFFDRINFMIENKSYTKHEDVLETNESLVYGFTHIKTNKIGVFMLMG